MLKIIELIIMVAGWFIKPKDKPVIPVADANKEIAKYEKERDIKARPAGSDDELIDRL
jgi:hypothetical protein